METDLSPSTKILEIDMIKLYDFPLSGHGHRARLMLSLLGLEHENINVDLRAGAQKDDTFLALNPLGQVPVLVDGDIVIRDSAAILSYLASRYAAEWSPQNPEAVARIQEWLATANKEIVAGPGAARLITVFGAGFDKEDTLAKSHTTLQFIDDHLENRQWLAIDTASIADIAAYAYIAHAPEGHVSLAAYHNIRAWLARVESLPGFVGMPQTEVAAAA
jgi:glutathione S-transferase